MVPEQPIQLPPEKLIQKKSSKTYSQVHPYLPSLCWSFQAPAVNLCPCAWLGFVGKPLSPSQADSFSLSKESFQAHPSLPESFITNQFCHQSQGKIFLSPVSSPHFPLLPYAPVDVLFSYSCLLGRLINQTQNFYNYFQFSFAYLNRLLH